MESIKLFVTEWLELICFLSGWVIAQLIKGLIHLERNGKWSWKAMFASGGMPSSHTSSMAALTIAIGHKVNYQESIFWLSLAVTAIISYDAFNVRWYAGRGISMAKSLVNTLNQKGIKVDIKDEKLKEVLGHRKIEVGAGLFLGLTIALIVINVFRLSN